MHVLADKWAALKEEVWPSCHVAGHGRRALSTDGLTRVQRRQEHDVGEVNQKNDLSATEYDPWRSIRLLEYFIYIYIVYYECIKW